MEPSNSPIVGIDLGTTNSVVAALINGTVQVIAEDGEAILPSVVGLSLDGKLMVGQAAKNQLAAFPERTIASVKRRMGEAVRVKLGDQEFTPPEISAMILRRLRQRAESVLGRSVTRAVITVPAFFDESQRQATREAGQLAGLTVERIINEPTAASLVYHVGSPQRRHLIVYDLGGGTFDVSIVRIEAGVVEVLSSKGDTKLGGDDFDQLLTKHVASTFFNQHSYDLMAQATTRWRLLQACERAKCDLSTLSSVRVTEEFIATIDGKSINLDFEISRRDYEDLIRPLVERTISCVDEAIRDAGMTTGQLDELILVGGSTRTPLVQHRLMEEFQRDPQWSVNPDLAVALGAATQAAMQEGHAVGPVLIDIATHTVGVEALSISEFQQELVYCPIIRRNSPLPAKYEERFRTITEKQEVIDVQVFQGESTQLSQNRAIGRFLLSGLNESKDSNGEILIRFELTLDGVLKVTALEKLTGLSKTIAIDNALSQTGQEALKDSEGRLEAMFGLSDDFAAMDPSPNNADLDDVLEGKARGHANELRIDDASQPQPKLAQLVSRARDLRDQLSGDDAADIERLLGLIREAEEEQDLDLLLGLETELDDLLFYVTE